MPVRNTKATPLNKTNGILPWFWFLGSAFIILILSPLFQKGCFIDGMLYKTVAYNYAEGLSSFWHLKFTATSMTEFCEQPPLYFYLLGSFYKIIGDHYLVDRIFTLLLFVLFIITLNSIVTHLFKNRLSYLLFLVFLFLTIPVFCWSYVNQVIEPLLCVLTGLAVSFYLKFLQSRNWFYWVLFSLILLLLFLTKGFQSVFVIVFPLTYMVLSKFEKANYFFSMLAGGFFLLLLAVCIALYQPAIAWFKCYYNTRLVLTMNNVGNTTDNHLEIIGRFFSELILCLIFFGALLFYLQWKKKYRIKFALKNFISNKIALALLITSFAGSFPYAISLVQRGFYLIPAFICFIVALVYGFKRYCLFLFFALSNMGSVRFVRVLMPLVFLCCVVYMCVNFNRYKRNEALLKDIDMVLPYLKKGEVIAIDPERWNDFGLHSYLYMARQVSLSAEAKNCSFLIRSKYLPALDTLQKIFITTGEIDLYVLTPNKK